MEEQQVEHEHVEQPPVAERKPPVAVRDGALRWWLQTVAVYLVVMYLSWTILDLTVKLTPSALAGGLYTSLFTFVLFGIPSLFLIGVVRLVEPKLPRWGFTLLATLTSLLPLLIAPEASLRELMVQLPAQLSLILMLHLPGWTGRRSARSGATPAGD